MIFRRTYYWYIPAAVLAVGIAVVSLMENPHIPKEIQLSDKTMHALMYALLAISLAVAIFCNRHAAWRAALWTIVATTVYGGVMELLQAWCTRTRSGDWLDVAADLIGAVTGFVLVWMGWLWYRHIHTT